MLMFTTGSDSLKQSPTKQTNPADPVWKIWEIHIGTTRWLSIKNHQLNRIQDTCVDKRQLVGSASYKSQCDPVEEGWEAWEG